MSDDNNDWYNRQSQGNGEDALPGDGESWSDMDEPKPLHDLEGEQWGTANPARPTIPGATGPGGVDGSARPNPGPPRAHQPGHNPGTMPGAGPQPNYSPNQAPNAGPGPRPYGQQPPGTQMTHPQNTYMTGPSQQLDTNDVVGIALNFFFPGAGYMVLGQTTKRIAILAATYLTCGAGYLLTILFVLDAYMVATARKKRPVDDWEFFPK